jgi:hypothetical protein
MSKNNINVVEQVSGGLVYRGYVIPGKKIEIHTHKKLATDKSVGGTYCTGMLLAVRLFVIGDEVEYDSFGGRTQQDIAIALQDELDVLLFEASPSVKGVFTSITAIDSND